MATYAEMFVLMSDASFQQRVHYGLVSISYDLITESASTPDHTNRVNWAKKVLNNASQNVTIAEATRYVCAHPSTLSDGSTITDTDLKFVLTTFLPDFVIRQ